MIRIGIIGMGFMGRTHYEAYDRIDDAQVVAIYSRSAKKAAGDLSGGWGNIDTNGGEEKIMQLPMDKIKGTTDWHDIIHNDEVDVVDVCVPTPLHEPVCVEALRAGKHVICEKPLALDLPSAERIARAAHKANTFFMPAMCLRFFPQWSHLKKVVDDHRYGPVRAATFRRVTGRPPGWFGDHEQSGSAILDLHVHDVDFILHLFGKPDAVHTSGSATHLITRYDYDKIPLVIAEAAWLADGYPFSSRFTVDFDDATLDLDTGRADSLQLIHGGKMAHVHCEGPDGWEGELTYFVKCVKTGRKPAIVTVDDAVLAMKVIDAEQRSLADRGVTAVL